MRNLVYGASALLLASCASALHATTWSVPLGGNAYITQSKNKPDETIDGTGLHNWDSAATTISTYVDVLQPGDLRVSLVGGLFGSTQSTVKVSIGAQSQTVALAPAGVANTVFPAGTFTIDQPGYVKIDLQGVSNDGGYFGDISALQLDGSATAGGLLFANDADNFYWSRRGPSVHLGFNVPAATEYFYSEVTVPVGQDPVGTYYLAIGFNVGYFGMQVNAPNKRWILFSVWDPTNGSTTLVSKGNQTLVNNFGGEGTGGQSHLICNWRAGNTYRFITRAQPDGQGNTLYSAWFGTPQSDDGCGDNGQGGDQAKASAGVKWHFLATWKYPGTAMYHKGVYSFLESFNPDTGYIGRRANFGNEWAVSSSGVWTEVTSAWYDVDPTGLNHQRADFAGGANDNQFYLRNDGFFTPSVASGHWFVRAPNGTHPDVDLSNLPTQ
jgi:hypothetical protein